MLKQPSQVKESGSPLKVAKSLKPNGLVPKKVKDILAEKRNGVVQVGVVPEVNISATRDVKVKYEVPVKILPKYKFVQFPFASANFGDGENTFRKDNDVQSAVARKFIEDGYEIDTMSVNGTHIVLLLKKG